MSETQNLVMDAPKLSDLTAIVDAKDRAAMARPKAPVYRPDQVYAEQAQALASRDQLEKKATNGLLLNLMRDRAQRVEIRDAQALIVAAHKDALAFEQACLDDQNAAIAAIDVLIGGLSEDRNKSEK